MVFKDLLSHEEQRTCNASLVQHLLSAFPRLVASSVICGRTENEQVFSQGVLELTRSSISKPTIKDAKRGV